MKKYSEKKPERWREIQIKGERKKERGREKQKNNRENVNNYKQACLLYKSGQDLIDIL